MRRLVAGIRAGGGMAAQLIGLAAYAGLGAGAAMGVATWLTGAYGDSFLAAAGLLALTSIGVGSVVAGAAALAGAPGVALTGIGVVLLGLVASGGPVGSQVLPDFYRAVAPWLPAGALLSALKGALFYGGVGTGEPVVVLTWESPRGESMLSVLRSVVNNPEAAALLRAFVSREVLARLAAALEVDQPELRAALAGSQLIGVAFAR